MACRDGRHQFRASSVRGQKNLDVACQLLVLECIYTGQVFTSTSNLSLFDK
jgi:hypothetical protein